MSDVVGVVAGVLGGLNASGWYAEPGHDCDGTEEVCALHCPIAVQVQIGPDAIAAEVAKALAATFDCDRFVHDLLTKRDAEQQAIGAEKALRDAAANMPLRRPGQPYEMAAGWIVRRANAIYGNRPAGVRGESTS